MKKGDVIVIKDSSYSFIIIDGYLEHCPGEVQKEHHIVIAVDCDLPADDGYMCGTLQRNDTIVRGQTSGRIAFVQQRFCRLAESTYKVMVDYAWGNYIVYGLDYYFLRGI